MEPVAMSREEGVAEFNEENEAMPAAEVLVRSLRQHGVQYAFSNLGTDHPPLLEAVAKVREEGDPDDVPTIITCPHESVALSAAHGYAVSTGEPQAVIVHVDVGTQNLGAMLHNAHRGDAPVFIFAGLAPNTHHRHNASRSNSVHFLQDMYDQSGIVREYCRWTGEYRLPGDPDELVVRGLELASSPRRGPAYLTATGEALETEIRTDLGTRSVDAVRPTPADAGTVQRIASLVDDAQSPLVITGKLGLHNPRESVDALVEFAEAAGAGVVESRPAALCFPRDHDLHVGFSPEQYFDRTDLIVLADVDVPWVPAPESSPPDDVPIVQIDVDPLKPAYPQWDLRIDHAIDADPAPTLAAVTKQLDVDAGEQGRTMWQNVSSSLSDDLEEVVEEHLAAGRLTPEVLSQKIHERITDNTVIVNETTTNSDTVLSHVDLHAPGSYLNSHGSGLGWGPGAAVGAKLGRPNTRVFSLVGDGSYVFGQPIATAWVAARYGAPTLTIVYNNSGWNAVRGATTSRFPDGSSAANDVPESQFDPTLDLSPPTHVVDAYSSVVDSITGLDTKIEEGIAAIEEGKPAVLDVRIDQR